MSPFHRTVLTRMGVFTAHPASFVIVAVYVVAWRIFDPGSFDWHAIATMATRFMTLIIQRAEHRDTQAIHAKLDELLRAEGRARSSRLAETAIRHGRIALTGAGVLCRASR